MSATPRPWKNKYGHVCAADGTPLFNRGETLAEDVNLVVDAVNAYDALKAQNARLKESLTEVLAACAAGMRVMSKHSLADEFIAEAKTAGVKDEFGSRAQAALRGEGVTG